MPFYFQATMFFEGDRVGWSESHSLQQDGLVPNHDSALEKLDQLARVRAFMLGRQCKIFGLRVSLRDVRGDSMPREVNYSATQVAREFGQQANVIPDCTQPDVALLMRLSAGGFGRFKNLYLRGIWDDIEKEQGKLTRSDLWKFVENQYAGVILSGVWGWWGWQTRRPAVALKTYTSTADAVVTVEMAGDFFTDQEVGTRAVVRFSGVNGKSALNGQQVVTVLTRRMCQVVKPIGLQTYRSGGLIRMNANAHIPYARVDPMKIVTRECGAPFLRSRGRQPARPRA